MPLARGIALPDTPGTAPLTYDGHGLALRIEEVGAPRGTRITARWEETGERTPAELDVTVEQPAGHESLNVVIPWSPTRFQYTSKHQARPAHGHLTIGGDRRAIEGAWGVLDVGRGRWPYRTNWNWGAGAGRTANGDHAVGVQLGGKWTVGTGFTENGVVVDGRLSKIGDELTWEYDWDDPMTPWRVTAATVDLTLEPAYDRHSRTNAVVLATEVHQVFGTWSGSVTDDDGRTHVVDGIRGFAEESRSRW